MTNRYIINYMVHNTVIYFFTGFLCLMFAAKWKITKFKISVKSITNVVV